MKSLHNFYVLILICSSHYLGAQSIWFVNDSALGSQSGTSWLNAFTNLQPAIDAASSGDTVFVAKGTYLPTTITGGTANNRDKAFVLKNRVQIYGGFSGNEATTSDRNQYDILYNNKTLLSGDLGITGDSSDNSFHVVVAINTNNSTLLDGLWIANGNANDSSLNAIGNSNLERNFGGGIAADNADLTINNCRVEFNLAYSGGGGMNNKNCGSGTNIFKTMFYRNKVWGNNPNDFGGGGMRNLNSSPEITDCIFNSNIIDKIQGGGGIRNENSSPLLDNVDLAYNETYYGDGGGGMYNAKSSNPNILNSMIRSNYSINQGGGMYNDNSKPVLNKVTFRNNNALDGGGGMENDGGSDAILNDVKFVWNKTDVNGGAIQNWMSSPKMINVHFDGNEALLDGGAIYNYNNCSPEIERAVLENNKAYRNGGAIYNRRNCNPVLTNILLTNNWAGSFGGGIYSVESNGSPNSPIATNITIVRNEADSSGGGGYDDGKGNPKLRNSIIHGNTAPINADFDAPSSLITTALSHVIISNDYYLGGSTAPVSFTGQLFILTAVWNYNYQLAPGSYAIDRGDSTVYNNGQTPDLSGISTDLRLADRIMGNNIDLGAYEVCTDTTDVSVKLSFSPSNRVIYGTKVTITALPTGGGLNPEYLWYKNGFLQINITGPVYEGVAGIDFSDGNFFFVYMNSSDPCAYPEGIQSEEDTVFLMVSVPEVNSKNRNFVIKPNPNKGEFIIESDFPDGSHYTVKVLDFLGREIFQSTFDAFENELLIDLRNSAEPGMYILSIWKESQLMDSQKFIVE